MKIETDLSNNYFACFDEARGIAFHKRKILKRRKYEGYSYMYSRLILFIWILILGVIFAFICSKSNLCCKLWFFIPFIFVCDIAYLIITLINVFSLYHVRRKNNFKNNIKIDKNGITDESFYGIKMLFKWKMIKAVVIGKYTITVLTDTPVYFYFSNEDKHKIIEAVDKYANVDLIIR